MEKQRWVASLDWHHDTYVQRTPHAWVFETASIDEARASLDWHHDTYVQQTPHAWAFEAASIDEARVEAVAQFLLDQGYYLTADTKKAIKAGIAQEGEEFVIPYSIDKDGDETFYANAELSADNLVICVDGFLSKRSATFIGVEPFKPDYSEAIDFAERYTPEHLAALIMATRSALSGRLPAAKDWDVLLDVGTTERTKIDDIELAKQLCEARELFFKLNR